MNTLLGKKMKQSQMFLMDGTRIPVTKLKVCGNVVIGIKTKEKNNYNAIQLGFGETKKANKALLGQVKGANLKFAPRFLKEVRIDNEEQILNIGEIIKPTAIFKPGDIVDVTGISKGKGYAGVVKRYHFKGGPRTHGQSDRERAPGSIGQTTTPGRVYKGKRMAGKMGQDRVTLKNLKVVTIDDNYIYVLGLVPGLINNLVVLKKVEEDKKFIPVYKEEMKVAEETKATREVKKENAN